MLQRDIIAVQSVGAAPDAALLHHVVLVEHIWQSGDADSEEQTRVCIVGCLVIVFLVERVEQRQTIGTCAVGIDQVLRGLVEVATAVSGTGDVWRDEAVAPVEVAVCAAVIA